MLYSTEPPFLFFAMNKTGSTSVQAALAPYDRRVRRHALRLRYERAHDVPIFKHARPEDVRAIVGPRVWDRSYTFCFVRNPFDRLVSLYHYHRQKRSDSHPLASELDFEEWLAAGGSGSASRTLVDFVSDADGRQVVDFVGRFEDIDADFAHVCGELGIDASLPQVNASKHRHWSTYYTDRAVRIVEERFAEDLERFDYAFTRAAEA